MLSKKKPTARGMAKALQDFNKGRKTAKNNDCSFCVRGKIGNRPCATCGGSGKKNY